VSAARQGLIDAGGKCKGVPLFFTKASFVVPESNFLYYIMRIQCKLGNFIYMYLCFELIMEKNLKIFLSIFGYLLDIIYNPRR